MARDTDRSDIRIQRTIGLVARLKPEWEEELARQVLGLRANVELHRDQARALMTSDPQRAREIWSGIARLYNRSWAKDYYEEAVRALESLDGVEHDRRCAADPTDADAEVTFHRTQHEEEIQASGRKPVNANRGLTIVE